MTEGRSIEDRLRDADRRVAEADKLLLATRAGPGDPVRATLLYAEAAAAGCALGASRASLTAAFGWGRAQDWNEALEFLLRAAVLGNTRAQAQLCILSGGEGEDWPALRGRIDLERLLTPPPLKRLTQKAMLGAAYGLAPRAFCAWLIERAKGRLGPAYINEAASGRIVVSETRTATTSHLACWSGI